ncbi:MAG: hypothetical protein ABI747_03875 [Candidatus Moraniibacteriota bacterium]
MQENRGSLGAVAAFAVAFLLLGGYVAYASFWSKVNLASPFVGSSFAKDGEDDGGDDSNDNGDSNNDEGDDNGGSSSSSKSEKEKAKKEAERQREAAKKQAEWTRERGSGSKVEDDGNDDNGNELKGEDDPNEVENDDDGDDSRGDNEGMYKDKAKTLAELEKQIAEARADILERAAKKGFDASVALAQLDAAQAKLGDVSGAFDGIDLERAKELAKAVKKAAEFSRGKTLHDIEEKTKDIAKIEKRISQTKAKLASLKALGGDTSNYESVLSVIESDFSTAKGMVEAGGESLLLGLTQLSSVERRAKSLKNSIAGALYALGGSDEEEHELETEHGAEVKDSTNEIEDIADAEDDSVGRAIKSIARTHADESKKAVQAVQAVNSRSAVARFVLGSSDSDLRDLETEIVASQARIDALRTLVNQIADPEIKTLLNEQIASLVSENARLQSYQTAKSEENGILGWLFRF